jgi:phenylpropionate dioxygenase-like ring-hydroxylating dioxygenase large terminal subunit
MDVRQAGINLNYWWPVAHRRSFPENGLLAARVGDLELLVFKDAAPLDRGLRPRFLSRYHVFEDACPHKRVRLSQFGRRQGTEIVCGYHGWKFDSRFILESAGESENCSGQCTQIPGMPELANKFCLKSYPVQEYGGWIWVFPGDPDQAALTPLPVVSPAQDPRYHPIPMEGVVNCHASYMTENATDLFHADLHRSQQPWANPRLLELHSDERTVQARYAVEAPRLMAALIGQRGQNNIQITYEYPYFHLRSEDGAFYLFVVYVPIGPQQIYVHSTFYFRHILNQPWILKLLHPFLDKGTFRQVFEQDKQAVAEEQRAYNLHGKDLSRETNPVSHAVRKVILQQTVGCPPLNGPP